MTAPLMSAMPALSAMGSAGDLAGLAGALFGGVALGVLCFGGLWLTLWCLAEQAERADNTHPALLLLGSFSLRSTILFAGLWWIGSQDSVRTLACAAGVIAVRPVFARLMRPAAKHVETKRFWTRSR
jgi:F1F0 ATPase subunit 2